MSRKAANPSRSKPTRTKSLFRSALLVALVLGGVYSAYLFYTTIKDFVAHAELGIPLTQTSVEQGRAPDEELPNVSTERVNILLLGTDKRASETGPTRTDTMILVTIDPQTRTAGMLSIPRDLWVAIPGYSENRINVAHFLGERDKYPGGGPALAKKTVQYTLGIPVHYYVRVNFQGFERIIDAIGGITIDVEEPIHDTKYPDENYGVMTIDIPAGIQKMDGKTSLQYARTRHGSSDFSRARRQQQVLKAVRDKVLRLNIPLTRIPEILKLVGDSVQTDLSLTEMYALAKVGRELTGDLRSMVIDENMTTPQTTPDGANVLIPNSAKIREAVNALFGGPAPTASPELSEEEWLVQEAAKIEVQNGTLTVGLAQRTSEYIKSQGLNVVSFSNADRSDYAMTVLVDYSGKSHTVNFLVDKFNIAAENVRQSTGIQSDVDIRLILGRDYAAAPLR